MAPRFSMLLSATVAASAGASKAPIDKVLTMMTEMHAKITAQGEAAQKVFAEFADFCGDRSQDLGHEIKTGTSQVESLKATIQEQTSTISSEQGKVEDLAASISADEKDLAAATKVRNMEKEEFTVAEKDLVATIDMITRATGILQREMQKGGAAMLQFQNANNLVKALETMVQAQLINSADASKLTAFAQESSNSEDNSMAEAFEGAANAPAGAVYESKSGGIVEALQGLQDKADEQLTAERKKEMESRHAFEMVAQSLNDQITVGNKEMDGAKEAIAVAGEKKAQAEGELQSTQKSLAADIEAKETLHQDCTEKAADFEAETRSRGEELAAITKAKEIIAEVSNGNSLAQVSFVQTSRGVAGGAPRAVRMIRALAKRQHSSEMSMLATRMASVIRLGAHAGGAGIFDKIKGLIADMLTKLEKEAAEADDKKAYCDKELAESKAKHEIRTDQVAGLNAKLDQAVAKSAQLKEQVATIQKELAALLKAQAEMDKLRAEEKSIYENAQAELDQGLKAIRQALKVIRDYYAQDADHQQSSGSGGGVISMLEVCEADFSKNLAEITNEEEAAVAAYDKDSKETYIEKTSKEGDIKYKTKEATGLDKTASELKADRDGRAEELDAVEEYLARIKAECTVQPMSHAEMQRRRAAEISGLKEALEVLDAPALVQTMVSRRSLRVRRAA